MASPDVIELDVRPLVTQKRPPLPVILAAVNRLTPGQALRLIAPFEPEPLYQLLAGRGYRAEPKERADHSWEVLFRPVEE